MVAGACRLRAPGAALLTADPPRTPPAGGAPFDAPPGEGGSAGVASDVLPPAAVLRGPLRAPHGMTLRAGGVSRGPYATLNLGLSVGDDQRAVEVNRARVAASFGLPLERVMRLDQVHGAVVRVVGDDAVGAEGDAVVSDDPAWLLAVSAADCLPVLLHDPRTGVVAAVHAGWRGAVAGVVPATVAVMRERFGVAPSGLRAWFGAAIRGPRYQVGPDVAAAFRRAEAPAEALWPDPEVPDRYRADVPALVRAQLLRLGVPSAQLADASVCTSGDRRCYSHRRDAGRTGRHWAVIRATSPS